MNNSRGKAKDMHISRRVQTNVRRAVHKLIGKCVGVSTDTNYETMYIHFSWMKDYVKEYIHTLRHMSPKCTWATSITKTQHEHISTHTHTREDLQRLPSHVLTPLGVNRSRGKSVSLRLLPPHPTHLYWWNEIATTCSTSCFFSTSI